MDRNGVELGGSFSKFSIIAKLSEERQEAGSDDGDKNGGLW